MLKIEGKTFMNIQEAVQWLLDNNALPFQSSANYIANTEIGLGTIVNPSPAKVRIGSLIFFADSKVSTVVGLTENGFIVSDQYNDLVDDVVYVSNVALDASGHLIVTLSNGNTIDAGLIKQISNFGINASQHLIAYYNDGTITDLGEIFNGDVNISGSLTAGSIIERMSGYTFQIGATTGFTKNVVYAGAVKNGNKLTLVVALNFEKGSGVSGTTYLNIGTFTVPLEVWNALYPTSIAGSDLLDARTLQAFGTSLDDQQDVTCYIDKTSGRTVTFIAKINIAFPAEKNCYLRYEATFLLSDPLNS